MNDASRAPAAGPPPGGLKRIWWLDPDRIPDLSGDPYRRSSLDPPAWRGRMHAAMILPALGAGAWLVASTPGGSDRIIVALYAASLVVLFTTSAFFHLRRWDDTGWLLMRRLDHLAILGLIAGSYGAIMALGVPSRPPGVLEAGLAVCAAGALARWCLLHPGFGLMTGVFLAAGGVSMVGVVAILDDLGAVATAVVLIGCVFYGAGALALGARWPFRSARRFGYHEIWHLNVIVAAACHFWVAAAVVVPSL